MSPAALDLGLSLGYWGSGPPPGQAEAVRLAEDLGFTSMWTAEAYGSDAFTPLTWHGASTTRLGLGTGIAQTGLPQLVGIFGVGRERLRRSMA